LKGESDLFFRQADLIGRDFTFEATAATAHIFQGNLHMQP
jgi:hypothetical protein